MKLSFRLRDPSPDWLAMRKVIENNGSLRSDVTLEVHEDACVFVDSTGQELPVDGNKLHSRNAVVGLDAKTKLLTMLHEKFSAQAALD